jgi:FAD-linked sulfhydryl oxidase
MDARSLGSWRRWLPPGVPKREWGPRAWNWLHLTAINYPSEPTREEARLAFRRIWDFTQNLPCVECRAHATASLLRRPPDLASSVALQAWVWGFHNEVNARLGKPAVSYEEYTRLYADEICWANWHEGCQASQL